MCGKRATLTVLQYVRFLAAMFVVYNHGVLELISRGYVDESWKAIAISFGRSGVYIFFAISGFVMIYGARDNFGSRINSLIFLKKRLIRIVPLYATATLMFFFVKLGTDTDVNVVNLIKSLFFIPYERSNGLIQPIVGKGWTLNYEMFFYLIFGIAMIFSFKIGIKLVVFLLSFLCCLGLIFQPEFVFLKFYTSPRIFYFLVGIFVFYSIIKCKQFIPQRPILSLAMVTLFSFALPFISLQSFTGVTELLISSLVVGASLLFASSSYTCFGKQAADSFISKLGDASYALYLFHGLSYRICFTLLDEQSSEISIYLVFFVYMILAIAISFAIHFWYDAPIQNRLKSVIFNPGQKYLSRSN